MKYLSLLLKNDPPTGEGHLTQVKIEKVSTKDQFGKTYDIEVLVDMQGRFLDIRSIGVLKCFLDSHHKKAGRFDDSEYY